MDAEKGKTPQRTSDMDRTFPNQIWAVRRRISKERHAKGFDPVID
jgi:hypothetical protein